ncbi:MAG: UDP-N-acetylmuramoyl-L-alanine--D-glutamate ligase [Bacilli bacterium]|nr:UDP-N-acetylmuramoyl-L-alanine--D-glutamate ligase [Bacilli bacterium]
MFKNKKIFILGLGKSGFAAAKLLVNRDNEIVLSDCNVNQDKEVVNELEELGVTVILGEQVEGLFNDNFDYLVINPGVNLNHIYVKYAMKHNIPVVNEVEIAYNLLPNNIKLIAITGTNGKTTTTTVVYEILQRANLPVHLTGNIGFPLCDFIGRVRDDDIVVMEISIQQLRALREFKPDIAVMTNLFPAHLDLVDTYENYKNYKKMLFMNQTKDQVAILNKDNNDVTEITSDIKATKKYFSSSKSSDIYLENDAIYFKGEKVVDTHDIKITGRHNYENIMAAIMVVKEFNVDNKIIREVLKEFAGVEHRIEYVRKINGVEFYNDSKATNIKSTQIALSSFSRPTILLLGGKERSQDFYELTEYIKNIKMIICYGETRDRIKEFADTLKVECIVVETLEEAVKVSYQLAEPDDIVLLSPASASLDQFKSFEERGNLFKECVERL